MRCAPAWPRRSTGCNPACRGTKLEACWAACSGTEMSASLPTAFPAYLDTTWLHDRATWLSTDSMTDIWTSTDSMTELSGQVLTPWQSYLDKYWLHDSYLDKYWLHDRATWTSTDSMAELPGQILTPWQSCLDKYWLHDRATWTSTYCCTCARRRTSCARSTSHGIGMTRPSGHGLFGAADVLSALMTLPIPPPGTPGLFHNRKKYLGTALTLMGFCKCHRI